MLYLKYSILKNILDQKSMKKFGSNDIELSLQKEINRKCLTNENDLFHTEIQIKEIK